MSGDRPVDDVSRSGAVARRLLGALAAMAVLGATVAVGLGAPGDGSIAATGVGSACPTVGETSGLSVRRWNVSDAGSPGNVGPLSETFTDQPDARGFPTIAAAPDATGNTNAAGAASGNLGRTGTTEWDGMRLDGWIEPPCAGGAWQLRVVVGPALGTYLGAMRSGAAAVAADDVLTEGGLDGQLVEVLRDEAVVSAVLNADPFVPVNVVALIDDRGASHALAVEERSDEGPWVPVPAQRIWSDRPTTPGPTPVVPTVRDAAPLPGLAGSAAEIVGSGFGASQGNSTVRVGGVSVGRATVWRDARIEFRIPDLPPGVHPVVVTVNGTDIAAGEHAVGPIPDLPPIANPVLSSPRGATVVFDGSLAMAPGDGVSAAGVGDLRAMATGVTGISELIWNFGDGTTSRRPVAEKTYSAPGTYNVSLRVTSASGATRAVGQTVVVRRSGSGLRAALPPVNLSIPNRVVFDFGSAEIRDEARPVLLKLGALIRSIGRRGIVGGHTDSIGPVGVNLELSRQRAHAVRAFLIREAKVSPLLLAAVGYGESAPLASNATILGRQRNRRVSIRIIRSASPLTLSGRTLQINQRIASAVLLREKALRDRLNGGLGALDLQNGSFAAASFGSGVLVSGAEIVAPLPRVSPDPIVIPRLPAARPNFPFTRHQLRTNERISATAVARVNALSQRLGRGLTGADVRDGSLTALKLAPGLSFGVVPAAGPAQPTASHEVPTAPQPRLRRGAVTEAILRADQRRSQAAIRRVNILMHHFEQGFGAEDFAPGTLGPNDVG